MKIDINKKYRYRNGRPARVVCVDGPLKHLGQHQPVLSIEEDGSCYWHCESGRFVNDSLGFECELDLIEDREPREWKASVRCANGEIYNYTEGDEERGAYEVVIVREIID